MAPTSPGTMAWIGALVSQKDGTMLRDEDFAILCDIQQSVAFAEDKQGHIEKLIIDGYVLKNGDIYQLTSKGEKVVEDRGAGLNEA